MEIRDRIQRICLEHRRNYGYRRVRRELKNQGLIVNEKRVRRLMREDDLLAARRKKCIRTAKPPSPQARDAVQRAGVS